MVRIHASANGQTVVNTIVATLTGLAAYIGTCGSLTQVACDDDSGGNRTSRITMSVTAGLHIIPGRRLQRGFRQLDLPYGVHPCDFGGGANESFRADVHGGWDEL